MRIRLVIAIAAISATRLDTAYAQADTTQSQILAQCPRAASQLEQSKSFLSQLDHPDTSLSGLERTKQTCTAMRSYLKITQSSIDEIELCQKNGAVGLGAFASAESQVGSVIASQYELICK